jgi:ribosomal protein L3
MALQEGRLLTVRHYHIVRLVPLRTVHRLPPKKMQTNQQDPGRIFKGTRMAGRMGGNNETRVNCRVAKIDPELGLILLKGPVPGPSKGYVRVTDALRKPLPEKLAVKM